MGEITSGTFRYGFRVMDSLPLDSSDNSCRGCAFFTDKAMCKAFTAVIGFNCWGNIWQWDGVSDINEERGKINEIYAIMLAHA